VQSPREAVFRDILVDAAAAGEPGRAGFIAETLGSFR
jgi:hypothetical protein